MPIARAAKRATVRLGAVVLAGALLAACGSGDSSDSSDSAGGKVTLNVDLFGSFGFKEAGLYEEYQKLNPDVTIKQSDTQDEADYWKSLQTRLAGGGGLADVQGVEVGRIASVTQQQADKFQDLKEFGADKLKGEFAEAKWSAATTKDGKILGLGTDVGPEAMCYRTDLFKQAGLPTDREEAREEVGHVGRLPGAGQGVQEEGPRQERLAGQRRLALRDHDRPGEGAVLRRLRRADLREEPGGQGSLGHLRGGGRGGTERQARPVVPPVEPGVRGRFVRDDPVPGLDARLRQGPGRRRGQGQVGHRRASPAARATGAARTSPSRARPSTRRRRTPSSSG